jgi:hypothetical protein
VFSLLLQVKDFSGPILGVDRADLEDSDVDQELDAKREKVILFLYI